ncbi:hypothetical protein OS493_012619, partial [Desmophyllum pertusum]
AWANVDQCIRIEGLLLTCDLTPSYKYAYVADLPNRHHGARHYKSFSAEFPYFEVAILETGEERLLGVGVVTEEYSTKLMPGWRNTSVGYHIDDGKIFLNAARGKETKGPAMARRGDRIRCTVMFENKREIDGKVPVVFTLNGKKIIMKDQGEDQIFMDADKPLYPYICMTDGCSALVNMCSMEDLDSKATAQSMEKRMTDMKEQFELSISGVKELIWESNKATNQKLETLLATLTDKRKDPAKV